MLSIRWARLRPSDRPHRNGCVGSLNADPAGLDRGFTCHPPVRFVDCLRPPRPDEHMRGDRPHTPNPAAWQGDHDRVDGMSRLGGAQSAASDLAEEAAAGGFLRLCARVVWRVLDGEDHGGGLVRLRRGALRFRGGRVAVVDEG